MPIACQSRQSRQFQLIATLLLVLAGSTLAGSLTANDAPKALQLFSVSPLPETLRGFEQFLAGDCDAASKSFTAATAKNPAEFHALYGLGIQALSHAEYQQALELFCSAFFAGRASPWGELYLEEIRAVLPYCSDPKPFTVLSEKVKVDGGLRPRLKTLLSELQGDWLLQRGQFTAVAEKFQPLQYIANWALAGPFDNRDKAGFSVAYEPENGIDFEKSMPGRNRRINWFRPQLQALDGRINLSELFEPRIHVLAYAVSFVKAPEAGWGVLQAGCAGALAVWVNEKSAVGLDEYNDFASCKLSVPVYLEKGWNQILVKSALVEESEWGFSMRLTQPNGAPLSNLTFADSADALAGYSADKKSRTPHAVDTSHAGGDSQSDLGLTALLIDYLKAEPNDSLALAAYGTLLNARNAGNKEDRIGSKQLSKAVDAAPKCPHWRLRLAALSGDNNEARQAAEAVLASQPELAAAYEMLTRLAAQSQLHVIAEDYARQAIKKFGAPHAGTCSLLLGEVLAHGTINRRAEAYGIMQPFMDSHPYCNESWLSLIDLENTQSGRRATIQKALSYCGADFHLRELWVAELCAIQKDAEAAEFRAAGLKAEPYSVGAVSAAAKQFRQAGETAQAEKLLDDARKWAPENTELLTAVALYRHHAGKDAEAVNLFREVLRIKPSSPQIKEYLSQLDNGAGTDVEFFHAYDVALKDIQVPSKESYPQDNVVNLLNQQVVRVNPNGSSSRMFHIVSKLLRAPGVNEISRHQIYYEPERQVVDILRAAVITPDGRELSRAEVQDRSTSAAMGVTTRIYDQHYLKQVFFKDLEPGCVVDLQYTIRDTGDNVYGDYFADTFYFSSEDPTVRSQYILDLPKSIHVQSRAFNSAAQSEHLETPDNAREVFKWDASNMPGVMHERGMPPVIDKMAQLQVTTMKTWQEVGQWYTNLSREEQAPSDEMRKDVAEMTRDCKTATDKLRVIHDWVIRKIRYLGIEFGRNGYKPHPASETYKALYGDCKDTATLLTSMLRAAGIDSHLVLIRTVTAGIVPSDSLAMPNLFNHCIAFAPQVDGKDYWIDGTTDFHRLGEVPYADQDAQVLVIDAKDSKFVQIPHGTAEENLVEQKFVAKVDKNGSGLLSMHEVRHGQWAPGYRELAETPGQYERYMKDYAAKRLNGAEVVKLSTAGPDEQGPMWMQSEFKLPALASQSGERKTMPATFDALFLSQRYAVEGKRKNDLQLFFPWSHKSEIVYEIERGLQVVALPEEAQLNESFGKYSRKLVQQEGTLTIKEEFELIKPHILVAEYEAFKNFCNKVDSLMEQKVLVERK